MPFSVKEKDRRYGLVRAMMAKENLDLLVVYGNSGRQGPRSGNLAYVSSYVPFSGQQALVFPREGEPILFVGVENQRIEAIRNSWVKDTRCAPMTPVPGQVCEYLRGLGGPAKRIGLSSFSILPVAWHQQFQKELPGKEWVEAGESIIQHRLVQSEEEIAASRRAAEAGDQIWKRIRECLREGMTELDIRKEMDSTIIPLGGVENFNMLGLASMANGGEAPWGYVIPQTERVVRRGDAVLLEISPRVMGYWNQIVRILSLGSPPSWLTRAYDAVRAARDECLKHLKPGGQMADMITTMQKVIEGQGYKMWPYGLAHITGLDLTDYMITPESKGTFQAGMVVTVHPMFPLGTDRQIFWGETYVVTPGGYELLNRASDELAVV
ncbi:MAG: Xaa-Pro peptidase family protein [Nitrospinota bacterium]